MGFSVAQQSKLEERLVLAQSRTRNGYDQMGEAGLLKRMAWGDGIDGWEGRANRSGWAEAGGAMISREMLMWGDGHRPFVRL